ncbi:hypothetical protein AGABI1DRAFT_131604 [Agaricus bisporus var. burnettii JB137-S8]|uniref:C2H2-type domain-containing protein n=1 Tax=Agaricus bisporus var. burnettii (strain JB137-S8 / ATCC MYA-4627 / FGSC 10392) TaxID=597362 RepID=K5XNA0_AGABU|nr:uncharacterized protein AGABI1DRAFT_131604 [Agaricus bisporus var. burnettii JB137-S8]EKM76085.1 hypothetical protein AGABI1DRAFT_131604 [Agaricus bisporus var. burnettii JB137-S8]
MSPQSVSLPSIHELFPEHLMNSPPSPRTSTPPSHARFDRARSSRNPPLRVPLQGQLSSGPSHLGGQRRAEEYSSHSQHPTLPRAPHTASESADAMSSRLSHSVSMGQDNYQRSRSALPAVPVNHSARGQAGPDRRTYLDSQLSSDRPDLWSDCHSGPSPHGLNDSECLTDDETPTAGAPSGVPRKHVCPICRKAFNRPSSLKIHYNTHTGATPFRCPWPRCGREFNVNSNMRRHLRNHTITSGQEVPDDGIRRRRRRSSANSLQSAVTTMQQSASAPHHISSRHQLPPPQHIVPSLSEASHHYMRYRVYDYPKDYQGGMDPDEMDEYHASEDSHRHMRMPMPITRGPQTSAVEPRGNIPRHNAVSISQEDYHSHSRSHSGSSANIPMRALTPGSSFHSSSPSPSPSPSISPTSSSTSPPPSTYASPSQSPALQPRQHNQIQYSPSMPYLRGTRDSHVSTALRPVFNTSGHYTASRR